MTGLGNKCLKLAVRNLKQDQSPWLHFSPATLAQQQNRQSQNILFCQMLWFFYLGIVLYEVRICHHLLTHSLTDRHLCCVHIFTISNTAAVSILVHVQQENFQSRVHSQSRVYILNHEVCLVSILLVIAKLLPK